VFVAKAVGDDLRESGLGPGRPVAAVVSQLRIAGS